MRINYQSDFKIIEKNMEGDASTPFKFSYYTVTTPPVIASFDGSTYVNCRRTPEGDVIVAFNNHGMGQGILFVKREYFLTDSDFSDGICNLVSVDVTGIALTDGKTDNTVGTIEVYPNYQKGDKGDPATWASMSQVEKDNFREQVLLALPEGLTMIAPYKTIDGAFIESPSGYLVVKTTPRKVSVFDIKDMYNVNIHVPTDGNEYSWTYAYANDDVWTNSTSLIAPEEIIIGGATERNLLVKNTANHRFVVVTWQGADAPTANGGTVNEQTSLINSKIGNIGNIEGDMQALEDLVTQETEPIPVMQTNITRVISSMANNKRADVADKLRPVKIMFVGNSFADLSTKPLGKLFESLGYAITIGVSYRGGATLAYYDGAKETEDTSARYLKYKGGEWVHTYDSGIENTLIDKLNDENWDIVFFQQGSASSGLYSTYVPHFENLQKWLPGRIQSLGYKTGWLMPWAWSDKRITDVGGNLDGGTTMAEMYANISGATQNLMTNSGNYINLLCPCGTAVQNQLNYMTQDQIYGTESWDDGQHPRTEGTYASTCTLFHVIAEYLYGKGLPDVEWSANLGVSEELFNQAKASALNAIHSPYAFTQV